MSRRGTTDRTVENQQTIKNLLKLEGNKICADCKRNKRTIDLKVLDEFQVTDSPQILDGQAGTLEYLSASGAQASIEGWGPMSVE